MDIKQENDQTMNINQINKSDFSKICRTCLAMEKSLSNENAAELFVKLSTSFGFELTQNDILPNRFCTECVEKINIIHEFKRLCLYSEQTLKNAMTDDTSDSLDVKIEHDSKIECIDLIEFKNYDSPFDATDEMKIDVNLLIPNVHLNESHPDDDITNHANDAKIYTVKEENTDDNLEQTLTNKSVSTNITSLFNQHVVKLEGDSGYRCQLCGKESKLRSNIKKHMLLHVPEEQRIHFCTICNKRYTRKDSYLKHLKEHETKGDTLREVKIYQCPECQRLFDNQDELDKHKVKHIPKEDWTYLEEEEEENNCTETDVKKEKSIDGKHKCRKCSKIFSSSYNLKRHMRTHIPIENRIRYCLYCDKRYINEAKYQEHLKLHENKKSAIDAPKVPCELCGKNVSSLQDHMRNIHAEKNYQCPECDQKFFHESRLKKHINIVHKNMKIGKRLLCPLCGKTFGSNRHFECHLADHEGKKLYKCEICNREFKFDSPYRKHMNKYHYHNVKKNFSCDCCGKKFASRRLVQNHFVVHTGEKPYACKVCDKRFSHQGAVWTHMKTHNVQK